MPLYWHLETPLETMTMSDLPAAVIREDDG